jgi:hypothetical protein
MPAALLLLLIATAPAAGQLKPSLKGRVIDQASGKPLLGAFVSVMASHGQIGMLTDDAGKFYLNNMDIGSFQVVARAVGYDSLAATVTLKPGELGQVLLALSAQATQLAEVRVDAPARPPLARLAAFENRRKRGRGQFITPEDIDSRRAPNLGAILGTISGVDAVCNGTDCLIRMTRSPRGCGPAYFLDGIPSDASAIQLPLKDIHGVEVYRGPSETPMEFLTVDAACGVISVWTRGGR